MLRGQRREFVCPLWRPKHSPTARAAFARQKTVSYGSGGRRAGSGCRRVGVRQGPLQGVGGRRPVVLPVLGAQGASSLDSSQNPTPGGAALIT